MKNNKIWRLENMEFISDDSENKDSDESDVDDKVDDKVNDDEI